MGTCFPNFDALKLGVYQHSVQSMSALADEWGFELVPAQEEVLSVEQAQHTAAWLDSVGVDFLLIQASSFALGDVLLPLASVRARQGLWFLPEPSFEGDIPLNSLTGFNLFSSISRLYLREQAQPFKWFYGEATSARFRRRLEITIRALGALKRLSKARIGVIGNAAPTFYNLSHDGEAISRRLGTQVETLPLQYLFERIAHLSEQDVAREVGAMVGSAARVQVSDEWLSREARISIALRSLAREARYDALALRCWPELQAELGGIAPCAAVGWLNETGIPVSCEGDVLGALSMLAAHYVSGEPATMTDLVALADESELALLWHCGPTPASWADAQGQALTYHPTLDRANPPDAPRHGVSSDLVFAPGPITIVRFSQDASRLFLASAEVVEGPSRGYAGSRGWVGRLRILGEAASILDLIETIAYYGLEHHYPLARGNWEDVFCELAAWANIEVLNRIAYRDYLVSPGSQAGSPQSR